MQVIPISTYRSVNRLSPGYFSYVMATEIISIGFYSQDFTYLSLLFHILGAAGYIFLIFLNYLRIFKFSKIVWQDITHLPTTFGCLSFVAATNTLAARFFFYQYNNITIFLVSIGILSFIFFVFCIFLSIRYNQYTKNSERINPDSLLLTISLQSIVIMIALLSDSKKNIDDSLWLTAYVAWMIGLIIYFITIIYIIYLFFYHKTKIKDMGSNYWMCMGASAISIVAGHELISYSNAPYFVLENKTYIKDIIFALWLWSTLWIPCLTCVGIYKYLILKKILKYSSSLWSMVFPLGMYTLATESSYAITQFSIIKSIEQHWMWIAFIFWVLVMYLFMHSKLIKFASKFQ